MTKPKPTQTYLNCFHQLSLRTPLLPYNFNQELQQIEFKRGNELMKYFEIPKINLALQIASPILHKELKRLKSKNKTEHKKAKTIYHSLYKYLLRMSSRPTPFGLFAGYTNGRMGAETKILFNNKIDNFVYTRKRLESAVSKTNNLLEISANNPKIKWYSNTTLYANDKKTWHFLERHLDDGRFSYTLEGILKSEVIDKLIVFCKVERTLVEITKMLLKIGLEKATALRFIEDAIDFQILISNLEINITGEDHHKRVGSILEAKIQPNDNVDFENNSKINLHDFCLKQKDIEIDKHDYFDLLKLSKNANFNEAWIPELKYLFTFLDKITLYTPNTRIDKFKKEFIKRYGTKKMKLVQVLDPETGINFLNSKPFLGKRNFIEDLNISLSTKQNENFMWWSKFEVLLNKKMQSFLISEDSKINLKQSDFDLFDLDIEASELPLSMFSLLEVFNENNKEKLFVSGFYGYSALNMVSKFGTIDKNCFNLIKEISQLESKNKKNKILAEIVHNPSLKISNILRRPHIRNYEIPYWGKSTLNSDKQILVNDLLISVQNNELILESKKLKKEIIPTLTCTHYYKNSPLPIYQFLAEFSSSKTKNKFSFNWGSLESIYKFLPRVEYKNIILSKAKWIFEM